jgi:hypothetical protein
MIRTKQRMILYAPILFSGSYEITLNTNAIMSTISMKKLYGLAYDWISEKVSHGLSPEEAHRQVEIVTDYLDFVWNHKAGTGPENSIKS